MTDTLRSKVMSIIDDAIPHYHIVYDLTMEEWDRWWDRVPKDLANLILAEVRKAMPKEREYPHIPPNLSRIEGDCLNSLHNHSVGYNSCLSEILKVLDET